jgi:NDP-sugar pyrophosphorylase family protein
MTLPVAILAGGLATRLGPLAGEIPKCLVDVAGRPFAVHQIQLLQRAGFTDVVFLVGHLGAEVRRVLGDGSAWGVRIRYADDGPVGLGTGGAIRRALDTLGDRFLVLYGDSYLECDYSAVAAHFVKAGTLGQMTVYRNEGRWDSSNVCFEGGRILAYAKENRTARMRHIDYGLGIFQARAFDKYPPGGPFDLVLVYQDLLSEGQLAGYEVTERFYEIGSPAGLEETRCHLAMLAAPENAGTSPGR